MTSAGPGPDPGPERPDPGFLSSGAGFGVPPAPAASRFRPAMPTSRDILSAIVVALALIIAGVPLGLLWGATTPKLDVSAALSGGILNESAYDTQAGADMHFALLALIFGLVAGALVGWRGRHGSWTLPLGLTVGGLAGSILAAQIGHWQESSNVLDRIPQDLRGPVSGISDFMLRSHGFLVVFPFAAVIAFLIVVTLTTRSTPAQVPAEPEPDRYWSTPR